ncbi:hypothetical protein WR25_17605 [Diploscapter pachys]|uniref:Uncharacterized protein n=1 Tax=Diploscapter pachys TaxID=2018661 RepID=A0A2A2KGZ4_9BILA|nr:hypothetical protein WR25_17605 [Diploscapter pachys]
MARLNLLIYSFLSLIISIFAHNQIDEIPKEASRNYSDVWIILILCIVLCFAIRHANDFYTGHKITLVQENLHPSRFRYGKSDGVLSNIERDFENMYRALEDKQVW